MPSDVGLSIRRFVVFVLGFLAITFVGLALLSSWNRPQEQSRLDLFQTDLVLQATEWKVGAADQLALKSILVEGDESEKTSKVYNQALLSYQTAKSSIQRAIAQLDAENATLKGGKIYKQYQANRNAKIKTIGEIGLRIGLLQARLGQTTEAISTWQEAINIQLSRPEASSANSANKLTATAQVLQGLWSKPIAILPDSEMYIRQNLDGWFQAEALKQLYLPQQRLDSLQKLETQQQEKAESAIDRLLIVNAVPVIGGILGVVLWIGLGIQRLVFPKASPLKLPEEQKSWEVPWTLLTTWEIIILWFVSFVFVSQFILPIAFSFFQVDLTYTLSYRDKALIVLISYVASVAPELPILQFSLRQFQPLPVGWFQFNFKSLGWLGWGIGGYLTAVPLVLLVSALNQQLLKGQGGGNPLLPILVESSDGLAKLILWMTLAIAAPFFEELLFRGFLLPSLTKFVPVWAAIAISGFCFAIAHLNIADVLPLTMLGMMLGLVYLRSRNLLAPMLLHSLWNSGSFIALLALGGK